MKDLECTNVADHVTHRILSYPKQRDQNSETKCKMYTQQTKDTKSLPWLCTTFNQQGFTGYASMPDIITTKKCRNSNATKLRHKGSNVIPKENSDTFYKNHLGIINYNYSWGKLYSNKKILKWKVYRCQLKTTRQSCCCSCNSDAMFEVMKGLYDCYKMKNCNHCNCVMCGHSLREERLLSEIMKSLASVGLDTVRTKNIKEKIKQAEKEMEGKSLAEKEKILRDLATSGFPLPKGKSTSEKSLIKKIRRDLGLPPEPKSAAQKARLREAAKAGLLIPLEGKTNAQKEKILKGLAQLCVPLPEGRTVSETSLIAKVKADECLSAETIPEKLRKAKASGLLTSLQGKSPKEKEDILKALANAGLPLPTAKTPSDQKIIDQIRNNLGLPPDPKTKDMKKKHIKAAEAGLLQPLEGKTPKEKKTILRGLHNMGIPLPNGRTPSEKSLVNKIAAEPQALPPGAKAEGLVTPLMGKTPKQKEKILRDLAKRGHPLPEGSTESEKKLIDRLRADLGLPPEPQTQTMRDAYAKAADAGLLQPLEGKTPAEKKNILRGLRDMGITLPEGRTPSEKALVATLSDAISVLPPTEKLQRANAAGILTPLQGKTPEQKEKILQGLAEHGLPLPEGKSSSEKKLIDNIRVDLGLPPEPKTSAMRNKYENAAAVGLLKPLKGKSPKEKENILRQLHDADIPLPQGRTPSEIALVSKIEAEPRKSLIMAPTEKMRKAKAAGFITPLDGKTPEQNQKFLEDLAKHGISLPQGKTPSEKKLIDKVRNDLGLPPEPKTESMRDKYAKAADAGILQPLEGKTPTEKKNILRGLHLAGIPLPEGRTASEKALLKQIAAETKVFPKLAPSDRIRKAKSLGLLTPLHGKTAKQKEKILNGLARLGLPLPEGKTESEKKLIDNVRANLGLPPEPKTQAMRHKYAKASDAELLQPLEGKSPDQKKSILRGLHDMGIPLTEGRTASEKSLIAKISQEPRKLSILSPEEKVRKAKVTGLLKPLQKKSPDQKEKILKGLANLGLPLPEGKTASDKKLTKKFRNDLGLPPEPETPAMRNKHVKAAHAGFLQPLEGKTPKEKKNILRGLHNLEIPLPEGRTASEKSLIAKVSNEPRKLSFLLPQDKIRKANAAGLLTSLQDKSPEQKDKILKGLAELGLSLPEGQTASDKKLIDKVRADLGLPPEPKTPAMRDKHAKAADAGYLWPLEGKSPDEKKNILRGLHNMAIPLPEGRTQSEKSLIAKITKEPRKPSYLSPQKKKHKSKAAGLLTPLQGKSSDQKEKILKDLAELGLLLPEGKTASENKLIEKVRADLGLPPEPKTLAIRDKHVKAADTGLLWPLEGKSPKQKNNILRGLHDMEIPLPEGRTASEKSLIAKIAKEPRKPTYLSPQEKLHKAKAAGLLTSLQGKPSHQKQNILKGLAELGLPLPEGKTASENKLLDKVRASLGLPPEPQTEAMRKKHAKAADLGLMKPLEGKSPKEKKNILQGLLNMGIPLPEGRTSSEKSLISRIAAEHDEPSKLVPSDKLQKALAAGLITPLEGKLPEEREKILTGLANLGLPLPEGKTASEKKLVEKVRGKLGLPPELQTQTMRDKFAKAADAGLLFPLEGKSPKQKEKVLQGICDMGIPLPKGRTRSEKALISKIKKRQMLDEKSAKSMVEGKGPVDECICDQLRPESLKPTSSKEKVFRKLAEAELPLPEGKTSSEKALIKQIKDELGIPEGLAADKMRKSKGYLIPLEGMTPKQKEDMLKARAKAGLPLPMGKTPSEKDLLKKIKSSIGYIEPSPFEKLKRIEEAMKAAKAAGIFTPLPGKSPEQQRKILKDLVRAGIPLPTGETPSEKKVISRVRAETGLPPEPKEPSLKEKYKIAEAAGIIQPLEGKTLAEKENILRKLHGAGIPLPVGRTPSEKAMINNIKAGLFKPPILSQRMKAAKAAGFLTPLDGKTPEEKEKILKGLLKAGVPLPESQSPSDIKTMNKIRAEIGLPPEPKTSSLKEKYKKAILDGIMTPLEGKSPAQKADILRNLQGAGIPLPEGRTPSEKALIKKAKAGLLKTPAQRLQAAKTAGLLSPLEGKTPDQKKKIIKKLLQAGVPLQEPKSPSEKKLIANIRSEMGLPPVPITPSLKEKYKKAGAAGIITPLEGKTPVEKENVLRNLHDAGIPLPKGRTPSEKAMIKKVKAVPPTLSQRLKAAKVAGLLTPLVDKSPEQKKKILKGLIKAGAPLPTGTTPSDKDLINKMRAETGLPPEPMTPTLKKKYLKALADGIVTPLEGKTPAEKVKILKKLHEAGIPLPEGRTPSEKALVKYIEDGLPSKLSQRHKAAKTAGLLKPLEGKTPEQKENILKAMVQAGIPLPEGKTASEKKNRLPLPEGRTRSEKSVIKKINAGLLKSPTLSQRMKSAKAAGLFTPLEGKTPEQKENILKGLVQAGIPLPEGKTASEKKLINKIRSETGLPPEPKTPELKEKYKQAEAEGLITPLYNKLPADKEKILRKLYEAGIPLPKGRSPSEKAMVKKAKAGLLKPPTPSQRLEAAKGAGLLTPLEGKTPEQKKKILKDLVQAGIPLPEGKTASEKKIIHEVRSETGLPPEPKTPSLKEKYKHAVTEGIITPLADKSPAEKEKILSKLQEAGIPLPKGRSPSEKAMIKKAKAGLLKPATPSQRLEAAKGAGLLTPLEGKTPEQKKKILKDLVQAGIPLPEGKTASEKKIINEVRSETGLPPEPKTPSLKEKYKHAETEGIITPLADKSPAEKEKILSKLQEAGIPLPKGRSPSEKAMIKKAKAGLLKPPTPSKRLEAAKGAELLTPIEGKTPEQKKKILKDLVQAGIPLPEGKTASEKKIINEVRSETGLPPEPKTPSLKEKYKHAETKGIITPLADKSPAEKEKILSKLQEAGIPLPKGRSPSEKAMIKKAKAGLLKPPTPSQRLEAAKGAGLLTPLEGKTPEQMKKILKDLVQAGIPVPEGKTASEKKIINEVRSETGLPPEPKTPSLKEKYKHAEMEGIITPLADKSPAEKEKILSKLQEAGIPLPKGRSPSEKAMIKKAKAGLLKPPTPSQRLEAAKGAGLLTPLEGKTPEQMKKILKDLVQAGIPLPEGKTASEKKIINEVRSETGLPPGPKTPSLKEKYKHADTEGIITPLADKSPAEKEKILSKLQEAGIPLPKGRSPSEKAMIKKAKAGLLKPPTPSQRLEAAKGAGLLTPLEGKTPEQMKKILKDLVQAGIPLPEGKTASEKKIINEVRSETGLPPEPKTPSLKEKYKHAETEGIITPLADKSPAEKEKILSKLQEAGIPLPKGRTPSEKAMIKKAKAGLHKPVSQRIKAAKAAGLLTPLEGKTAEQKENILKGLVQARVPLPEGKTPSEKKIINKVIAESGLPPEPKTPSMKEKYKKAVADGLITPLEGKTPAEKAGLLKKLLGAGLPLPESRTPSEKSMIKKMKADVRKPQTPSQRLETAKAAGLLTPLEGKKPEQKEKILKGLVQAGIPLPEGKAASDKKLLNKIRFETGLPPEPKSPSLKEKYKKAEADGIIVPLEGKSHGEKENILRNLQEAGIPLPEGRTLSEKEIIRQAKAGLLKPPTLSQRHKAAKAAGYLTPLEGKASKVKGKIIRGLIDAGLPLPTGKTASQRDYIRKIADKSGLGAGEKRTIGVGAEAAKIKSKAVIAEKIEEATKTTVCDHACGCDKKKIRFKHSYVKIRVTSPDITSFCPCPDKCFPTIQSGVFVDNEGIKVTIGSAISIPSFFRRSNDIIYRNSKEDTHDNVIFIKNNFRTLSNSQTSLEQSLALQKVRNSFERSSSQSNLTSHTIVVASSSSDERVSKYNQFHSAADNRIHFHKPDTYQVHSRYLKVESGIISTPITKYYDNYIFTETMPEASSSILIIKSQSYLSFSSSYESIDTNSIPSTDESIPSNTVQNLTDIIINIDYLRKRDDSFAQALWHTTNLRRRWSQI